MSHEEVVKLLKSAGEDILVFDDNTSLKYGIPSISAVVNNFEGFDENGRTVFRTLDNPKLVESIKEKLLDPTKGFCMVRFQAGYTEYIYDDFMVVWRDYATEGDEEPEVVDWDF